MLELMSVSFIHNFKYPAHRLVRTEAAKSFISSLKLEFCRYLPGMIPVRFRLFNFFNSTRCCPKLAYPPLTSSGSTSFNTIRNWPPPYMDVTMEDIRKFSSTEWWPYSSSFLKCCWKIITMQTQGSAGYFQYYKRKVEIKWPKLTFKGLDEGTIISTTVIKH